MTTRRYPSTLAVCAWFAAAGLVVAGRAAQAAQCPSNQLICSSSVSSSAPSDTACCSNVYGFSCGRYDIPTGTLNSFGGGGADVTMSDSFYVVGPALGTPLQFTAQLTLSGSASRVSCTHGAAAVRGRIAEGSSTPVEALAIAPPCGTVFLNTTLEVQIQRLVGERFRVTAFASFGGYEGGSGSINGTLRFAGLPTGVSVVSCNGFLQGPPVAVSRDSWGALKTLYR